MTDKDQFEPFCLTIQEGTTAPMEFKLSGEFMVAGLGYDREGTISALKEAINNPNCTVVEVRK